MYENEPNSPIFMNQLMLNDLVRDLVLLAEKAELLIFLKQALKLLFIADEKMSWLCFCYDIFALMQSLGYEHIFDEWRLFIDPSKTSLKAGLLHNGNTKPSVPVAYAVNMKESYKSMKTLLEAIDYS